MNTYEITKSDGTTVTFETSGYSWDMRKGSITFYDMEANAIAGYPKGTWISLHMRSPLVMAHNHPIGSPAIRSEEFALYYGH